MKLKADFFGDWINILKNTLSNEWGCNIASVPDSKIPVLYFNTESRRPAKKIREVILADTFVCPKELEEGFNRLISRVESGKDLTMNLSKKIFSPNKTDPMLNDWGVHHFHLNENDDGSFEKGSEFLVFAWLFNDKFYVIGIFAHKTWENKEVVEIMHRNWSKELEGYKVLDDLGSDDLTEQQRKRLREAGVNVISSIEGGPSYFPIGGGFAGQGFNVQSVIQVDKQKIILRDLQNIIASKLEGYLGLFVKRGYKGEPEIEAVLSMDGADYIVTFPKYDFSETYELR